MFVFVRSTQRRLFNAGFIFRTQLRFTNRLGWSRRAENIGTVEGKVFGVTENPGMRKLVLNNIWPTVVFWSTRNAF